MAVVQAVRTNSIQTILTYDNGNMSQWSVIWSTTHIPDMDNAFGAGAAAAATRPQVLVAGRRRLRMGALVMGSLMTMHCRVPASALTGGVVVFIMFLIAAVAAHANPMRHFEVYLGQWSISGPGRAFRLIPVLDGIGIAICINAVVRAICCGAVAAIAAVYVMHSLGDAQLPFTYCRDFNLKTYPPIKRDVKTNILRESRLSMETALIDDEGSTTVGLNPRAWRNVSKFRRGLFQTHKVEMCMETYNGIYPALYSTPAYNFFYVEVVHLRSDLSYGQINITLMSSILCVWGVLWIMLITERLRFGRLVWNNVMRWMLVIPWTWALCLTITCALNLESFYSITKLFRIVPKDLAADLGNALEVALYIHSVSVGTEIITGKGLNHYASGHIDPLLNSDNVWHSCLLLVLASVHSLGASLCALVNYIQPTTGDGQFDNMQESTLWIIPMYSKCTAIGGHSHLMSTLIFGGLMLSYMAIAFSLLKTALHTIFEYKVKLVFVEQIVVGALILSCIALSLLFATNGGIALLESVDTLMTGVALSYVCLLELCGLLYVYRSHDFVSDMNVATEENTCSTRIGVQWQIIPIIAFVTLAMKIYFLLSAEYPKVALYMAMAPLAGVVAAVPVRACVNAYMFLRPQPRRGT